MKKTKYFMLNEGDEFMLQDGGMVNVNPSSTVSMTIPDKRVFRKDKEGATQIMDEYGNCEIRGFKIYPYLGMDVYVKEGEHK